MRAPIPKHSWGFYAKSVANGTPQSADQAMGTEAAIATQHATPPQHSMLTARSKLGVAEQSVFSVNKYDFHLTRESLRMRG